MRPSEAWRAAVACGRCQFDAAQESVLPVLDRIHGELLERGARGWVDRFFDRFRSEPPVRGMYLHGGVGRGKTFLVDLLHDQWPDPRKKRLHFHRFMGRIHERLRALPGVQDPLQQIAAEMAAEARLFCLDEFIVQDIGDAMLLGEFLRYFFDAGATLVTTSNLPPQRLYEHGLQRARFLPAIALIERHCEVLELASRTDYRLRTLSQASVYRFPADAVAERALDETFAAIAPGSLIEDSSLRVLDREIPLRRLADGIAWFDFSALCEGPRAVADYIEIARSHHTVLISRVPQFDASQAREDAAKRFIHLVDEFYDRNVNLIVSAEVAPVSLYRGQRHRHEFERTVSRLIEMQSHDYLAREHQP